MGADATAGIVIIGDEILAGQFAEENASFLIGELRSLGVSLRRIAVIPDEVDDIAETVGTFARRFDHVFTSGGVGPTHDDVTMAGIARAFGVPVVHHPEMERLLRAHLGDALGEGHARLAEVPEGAEVVYGSDPHSPVVRFRNVYILPGVPSLFRAKFRSVAESFRCAPFVGGAVYCTGDEASIKADLDAAVAAHPDVSFGSYPRFEERAFQILVTIKGKDAERVAAACSDLAERLGSLVVRVDEP